MAISTTQDVTADFNADGSANVDLSGWDSATVQLIGPAAAVSFLGSNDDGSVTGSVQGSVFSALNFTALFMTNLATGVGATTGAVAGLWRSNALPRFLQLTGTTATKILVFLSKID